MRWLVTGAAGLLGSDVVAALRAAGEQVSAAARADLDVLDVRAVAAALPGHDVVVHCAAFTGVDDAETNEAAAFALNALAARSVAEGCDRAGARMLHVSTDYVFDGTSSEPYDEGALVAPRSAYGRTKAAGEWAVAASHADVVVLRTAWLYGAAGSCFPRTVARVLAERGTIAVVDDQVGQPTWTADVAALALRLVQAEAPAGTYHATASGRVSWHGFAEAVADSLGLPASVVTRTTTARFPRPAARPAFSVLGHAATSAAGVRPIGPWDERWAAAAGDVVGAPSPQAAGPAP